MSEDVVDGLLRHFPRHTFLRVLAHEVAILAGKLAVLRHDERDVLRYAGLPIFFFVPNSFNSHTLIISSRRTRTRPFA